MKMLRDIRQVFRKLRHKRLGKIYCPRCGSARIQLSSSLDYWLTPRKYACKDCSYIGPVVMELEEEESQQ